MNHKSYSKYFFPKSHEQLIDAIFYFLKNSRKDVSQKNFQFHTRIVQGIEVWPIEIFICENTLKLLSLV